MAGRVILVLPEILEPGVDETPLRERLPNLAKLRNRGTLRRLGATQHAENEWLGLPPETPSPSQGVLVVSALKVDPPPRSVHFQLSLLSLVDGNLNPISYKIPPEILDFVWSMAERLRAKDLTPVQGWDRTHGLVWENGSDEMRCLGETEISGKPLAECLPEGDGDRMLRRFIDDSINLLFEAEFNQRRVDDGLPPINVLWPWGPGFRPVMPNRLLETGPVKVVSPSMRLAGLARLINWVHPNWRQFGEGTALSLDLVWAEAQSTMPTILVLPQFAEWDRIERKEERHWFANELDLRLLGPIEASVQKDNLAFSLLMPSSTGHGLWLDVGPTLGDGTSIPCDERALDERSLISVAVWSAVEASLS